MTYISTAVEKLMKDVELKITLCKWNENSALVEFLPTQDSNPEKYRVVIKLIKQRKKRTLLKDKEANLNAGNLADAPMQEE